MPFIGQEPITGAYHVLDDITTSSTNTYNLLLNGGAFSPASANHLLVSLNGVIQKPGSSFTISGSQITFVPSSGTLSNSDNIDFIMALGDVLNIGTPTDGTVTSAKLDTNIAISGNLDVGTIRHTNGTTAATIDTAGRIQQPTKPAFSVMVGATYTGLNYSSGVQAMDVFGSTASTGDRVVEYNIGNHLTFASDIAKFTAPVSGLYQFSYLVAWNGHAGGNHLSNYLITDSTFSGSHNRYYRTLQSATDDYITNTCTGIIQLTANQTVEMGVYLQNDTNVNIREGTRFQGYLVS